MRQQGVLGCAYKAFDLELLLDGFEEELDLPAVLVDRRNGACGPREVVRQDHNTFPRFRVSAADEPETGWIFLPAIEPSELDRLVGKDVLHGVGGPAFHDPVISVGLEAGDEVYATLAKGSEPYEVEIALVEYCDIAFLQGDGGCDGRLVHLAGSHHGEGGKIAAVVKFDMKLDRPLGCAELGPVE